MQISVFFFASLRDRAGTSEVQLEVSDDARVNDLMQEISRRFPELSDRLQNARIAVNEVYVRANESLRCGDRIALIPPVSGGCHV